MGSVCLSVCLITEVREMHMNFDEIKINVEIGPRESLLKY